LATFKKRINQEYIIQQSDLFKSLHFAVVKADDRYTPLDLVRANANELTTDEEYNNEVKRQWSPSPPKMTTTTTIIIIIKTP